MKVLQLSQKIKLDSSSCKPLWDFESQFIQSNNYLSYHLFLVFTISKQNPKFKVRNFSYSKKLLFIKHFVRLFFFLSTILYVSFFNFYFKKYMFFLFQCQKQHVARVLRFLRYKTDSAGFENRIGFFFFLVGNRESSLVYYYWTKNKITNGHVVVLWIFIFFLGDKLKWIIWIIFGLVQSDKFGSV